MEAGRPVKSVNIVWATEQRAGEAEVMGQRGRCLGRE